MRRIAGSLIFQGEVPVAFSPDHIEDARAMLREDEQEPLGASLTDEQVTELKRLWQEKFGAAEYPSGADIKSWLTRSTFPADAFKPD